MKTVRTFSKQWYREMRQLFPFNVTADEITVAYVEAMYELTGGKVYSDLALYKMGYGAELPEEPGNNMGFVWTDAYGNLMKLNSCHSGIFIIYTKDKRWRHIFSSCRMEETVYKYLCQLKKGTHWNKPLQHYFNIEQGDLEIDILELCPRRFLKLARKKWFDYYGISTKRKGNAFNKNFNEKDYI